MQNASSLNYQKNHYNLKLSPTKNRVIFGMRLALECIPCFLSQSLEATRMASGDEKLQAKVMRAVMSYLQNVTFDKTPPEISMFVHKIIRQTSRCTDPYKKVKVESNKNALRIYPKLRKIVERSNDKLLTAVKLAVAGNVIDYGTSTRLDVSATINNALKKGFAINNYSNFKKDVASADSVLYIADNAGELVFDKLLLEQLSAEVWFAVKPAPIINDATVEDAKFVGIDKIAKIVTTGSCAPGAILKHCSKQFLALYKQTDIVLAKGQGNYEALSAENKTKKYFLLVIKCPLVARALGAKVGDFVLKGGK